MILKKVFILVLFCIVFTVHGQNKALEQLKVELKAAKHDTIKCEILDQLIEIAPDGEWQMFNGQMQKIAISNLSQKQDLRSLFVFSKYYATSLHNQGIIYSEQSNDNKAVEYFNKSIEVCKKSGNRLAMAISMQSIAQIDIRKGNNIKALGELYECLKIFEAEKDEIGIADVHLSIGDICFLQRDFKKALEHHEKSYELYSRNKYNVAMSTISYKVGVDYFEAKNYPKALEYLQKSIDLYESSDYGANSVAYLNIAQIFIYQEKYDTALEYVGKGLATATSIQNKLEVSHSEFLYSKIYKLQKKNSLAIEHAQKALKIATEIQHPAEINMAAKQLYDIYKENHKDADASKMFEIYVETKKIIDNQESKNALLEQKLKHEYEKKEIITQSENARQVASIKAENEKQNLRKNIWLIVFGSVLLLLVVSAYFIYKNVKQKSVITNQKNNLLKQKLLVSQMNPHFIFNSLNAIQNYIFKQDSLKAGTYLTQFSELIRMILDYSRKDYITIESEVKLLTNYMELQKLRFENKFDFSITIDRAIEQENMSIPPMLAQPFIENAIEHGIFYKADSGRVDVRLYFENENLVYEIEDNGIGLEEAMKLKSKLKSSYESLATVITKERMNTISEQQKSNFEIEILDKKHIDINTSGVKVKFTVPFILD